MQYIQTEEDEALESHACTRLRELIELLKRLYISVATVSASLNYCTVKQIIDRLFVFQILYIWSEEADEIPLKRSTFVPFKISFG